MEGPEVPRALRDPDARLLRRRLLDAPHMRPLNEYVAGLGKRPGVEVPDFDPLDGGVDARVLFLFEKPGRMTVADGGGSGFISRDNDDPTAEKTFLFMREAGIPRKLTVTWNVIPWWNGTRTVKAAELREGAEETRRLTGLRAVVFVGAKASRHARPHLKDTGLAFFSSRHPSPIVRATRPDEWRTIPSDWAEAGIAVGLR